MALYIFPCNPFQANTYLWADQSGECVLIDATFQSEAEWTRISDTIRQHGLRLKSLVVTHYHFDHVIGVDLFKKMTGLPVLAHEGCRLFVGQVVTQAAMFGVRAEGDFAPSGWIAEGDVISVGESELKVIYTPGHADGSICLYVPGEDILFAGDVLFNESVGRTDLPTGDFQTLLESITAKLFRLPDATVVYPGHGPETSIGHEKRFNPFL